MKKLLSLFLIISLIFGIIKLDVFAEEDNSKYFIVTAYYSPLPDQNFYLKGNYEAELRLNGMGIRGASGKGVFEGMLAAPKNYEFGTKIKLDGLGIGSVEDRGGAIVNAGNRGYEHDRIDVWMGYGDTGLRRALFWGKRKVKGTILSNNTEVNLDINKISAPLWATNNLKKYASIVITADELEIIENQKKLKIFDNYLYKNSDETNIKLLQERLTELGLYTGELSGNYNDIIEPLVDYQLSKNLIPNIYAYGAGYFGPQTRKNMKLDYENYIKQKEEEELRKIYLTQVIDELTKKSENEVNKKMTLIGKPIYGNISSAVRKLQISLKNLGHFEYKDTAIFGKITKESIISFQLENNIITSKSDHGAGVFGPKTRESFKKSLNSLILNKLLAEQEIDKDELVKVLDFKI